MDAKTVYETLVRALGARVGEATAALGYFDSRWYIAKQGGRAPEFWTVRQGSTPTALIFGKAMDVRAYVSTSRKKSEWSSYHAEALVLSGMVKIGLGWDLRQHSMEEVRNAFADAGGAYICADAPCCFHCGNLLTALGVGIYEHSQNAGLTGWWNPVSDERISNGDLAYKEEIPTQSRGFGYY